MVIKRIIRRLRREEIYANRFLKFYYLNKKRLLKERKKTYRQKRKAGICVRCHRKALPTIVFCAYHQQKHKGYNKARSKT